MKKYVWILMLLCSSRVGAQGYFDSSVHYLTIGHNTEDPEWYWHSYYHMVLDSVSNDTEYYSMVNNNNQVYHRYKVIDKRVYEGTGKNYLLYDFNLKEGDTAWVNGGFGPSLLSQLRVDSIRAIQLGPFTYNAQYVTVKGILSMPFVFIEHIGSLENGVLFYDCHGFEWSNELITLCKSDTLMLWRDHVVIKSGQNTCHPVFYTSIEENTLDRKAFAYPNPSNGMIQISSVYADEELVLEIYNMNGQKMLNAMKVMAGQEIDLQYLPKGLYCVRLLTVYGTVQQVLSME